MWIFPKYKTNLTFGHAQGQYGAFNKNVRRNWGVWPMWISSANDKGFLATASTIVYDDKSSPDGRGLWVASTFSNPINATPANVVPIDGTQWYGCEFDDEGHTYFCGIYGTTKRGIMDKNQVWINTSTQSNTDYVVRYNNGFLYIGSDDFYDRLRKVDKNGNTIWSRGNTSGLTSSTILSIDFDESNNIYICGQNFAGGGNGIIAKYDESGNQLWSVYTGSIMYDVKYYNKSPQTAPLYFASGGGGSGAGLGYIHLRQTNGTDAGYFGTKLTERGNDYYTDVEVNDRYVMAAAPQGDAIDVYMRNLNSWTASYIDTNLMEITDLELYEDNLYFSDRASFGGPPTIYRLNGTFSRIEESWQVSSYVRAIRMKKTY